MQNAETRQTIYGNPVTKTIGTMSQMGLKFDEIRRALDHFKIEAKDTTLRAYMHVGKRMASVSKWS